MFPMAVPTRKSPFDSVLSQLTEKIFLVLTVSC